MTELTVSYLHIYSILERIKNSDKYIFFVEGVNNWEDLCLNCFALQP